MSNILKGLTDKLSWLVKSSQNSPQDATWNFSQQSGDIFSLSQKPENLQIFIDRILQKKEISEREIWYVIDFLQNIPEIQGSRQNFSGPQIAGFFQNLLKNPTMEQAGYITRTANLRDIAERFVADGPISYLPEDGLPIIHYQMMNKEILTENDIDYVINYIRDIIGTIKSDSREYSPEYMAARFEDLKKNPTEEKVNYITRAFGLREIAEKFVQSKKSQANNVENFAGKWSPIDQGICYNEMIGKPFSEKILDGMIDGGWWAHFFDNINGAKRMMSENPELKMSEFDENGKKRYGLSPREFIKVDYSDENLQGLIWNMRNQLVRKSDEVKAQKVAEMVFYLANIKWQKGIEGRSNKLSGIISLLDAFDQGAAVCRHRSLLFHILAQEVWLDTRLMKWFIVENGQMLWKHAWNEVKINGEYKVIDTTYTQWEPERLKDYSELPSYSIMRGENDFVSIAWLREKRKPGHI